MITNIWLNNKEEEKQLVTGLKSRQPQAYEDFYDLYAPAFYGTIRRTLYGREVSEEILIHIFQNVWKSIDSYDPSKERLYTWAMRMAGKEICNQKINIALKDLFYCRQCN